MAFIEVDEPAMLDSTGQEIVDKLDAVKTAVTGLGTTLATDKANRDASNITDASAWQIALGLNWTFLGQKTGSAEIDLPSSWKELIIQVHPTSNANLNTYHLYAMQTSALVNTGLGSFGTSYAVGQVSQTKAKLSNCVWGGSDVTNTTITYYYYR